MPDRPRSDAPAAVLCGLGAMVPPRVVTNQALADTLDTTPEWIVQRTGIHTRHVVDPGTSTADLAVAAGSLALSAAGRDHVDAVVLATTTPDRVCPATAPAVAAQLKLGPVAAFDVSAVCTGFVYGLAMGSAMIGSGMTGSVLVIGADRFSSLVDPTDRSTAVIFGDGAGAVVLEAGPHGTPGALLGFDLGSDGTGADLITVPGDGSAGLFRMEGAQVFRRAVRHMADSSRAVLSAIGWPAGSVDHLVGHQANLRILHAVAEDLDVPTSRLALNIDAVGNTSAASIPLVLADVAAGGTIRPGDRVLLTAFGGGLTWGATALVWPDDPGLAPETVRRRSNP